MRKYIYILLTIFLAILLLLTNLSQDTPVIIFFKLDEDQYFTEAITKLALLDEKSLAWDVRSNSSQKAYLRQDVSLLYENGRLKGVQSKWKQQVSFLEQEEHVSVSEPSFLQAISYHYGELHHNSNDITSMQQMTGDYLFVDEQTAFKLPHSATQYLFTQMINEHIENQLNEFTYELLIHFNITPEKYHQIPLTELVQFEQKNLLQYTQTETDKIMGQLWEGLYKNYLLPAIELQVSDYMPIILFAKDRSHLLVVFELNKEKYMLKQMLN